MPEAVSLPFVTILGQYHAEDRKWEVGITGADRAVAIVIGKAGQSFDDVFSVARRSLSMEKVAS
jgi:hypothetical protein